jgi:hypothetical protein
MTTAVALFACVLTFAVAFWAGKKSLVKGLVVTLGVGYLYGIARANILSPFSHFFFDTALLGLFASQKWTSQSRNEFERTRTLRGWLIVLIGWPCLMCLLPFQTILISLVGLRGNVFFLPNLLLGARLNQKQWISFAMGLAALNLIAVGFGTAEYFLGVPSFFPRSPVTEIIYRSKDVAGFSAYRIPAVFANAHAYAGSMTCSLPFLLSAWSKDGLAKKSKLLLLSGILAALMGVLMASTRTNIVVCGLVVVCATLFIKMRSGLRTIWIAGLAAIVVVALTNARFQRFKSIDSVDVVSDRVAGSVNRSFLEVMFEYPLGNGLGGGGTSIPYFLASQVRRPVSIENEYGRIMLEQGIIGLLIWTGFMGWCFSRPSAFRDPGKRLAWVCTLAYALIAGIGTGFLTAIPQTMLVLLAMGWISTPSVEERRAIVPPVASEMLA